jgi:hypothetical protein
VGAGKADRQLTVGWHPKALSSTAHHGHMCRGCNGCVLEKVEEEEEEDPGEGSGFK